MLTEAFQRMLKAFGPQKWWPADSRMEVMVGAILTQNTNWKNVELAIQNLRTADLLTLERLHEVPNSILEQQIRPAGYFRQKTRRLKNLVQFVVDHYGQVDAMFQQSLEQLRPQLLGVNGIGPETADSILLYAGDKPTFVIDAYTARIAMRHGWIDTNADYQSLKTMFESRLDADVRLFNEYHALIVQVGKEFCRPNPKCEDCPLAPMLPLNGIVELHRR